MLASSFHSETNEGMWYVGQQGTHHNAVHHMILQSHIVWQWHHIFRSNITQDQMLKSCQFDSCEFNSCLGSHRTQHNIT